jgi:RPA family protein
MLREVDPPVFVALVGKPRTYETDDGDTNVSLRPEHLTVVDADTRNRWVTETAKRTLERIKRFDDDSNEYAAMAREEYETTSDQYRQTVIQALEELTDDTDGSQSSQEQASRITPSTAEDASDSATEVSADEDSTSQSGDDIGDFDTTDLDS